VVRCDGSPRCPRSSALCHICFQLYGCSSVANLLYPYVFRGRPASLRQFMPEQRPAFIAMTCWIKRCYWFDNYERRLEIYLNRELRQTMQSAASSSTSALDPRLVTGETACQLQTGCPRVSVKMRNTTAQYLVEDCQLVSNTGRRRLRSVDVDTCIVPLTRTRLGDRSFSVAGPRLWNSLPAELRQPDVEIGQFRRLLKTSLFERDCGA